ncbi:hypothetical protein BGZ54_005817 [Gamsiella multidivaricata]|nr:hypothetical protein BGZ54_005817 [Gamsiella multidivaricata]
MDITHAFHHNISARSEVNMFEQLPTEILCTVLEYVVEPGEDRLSASDDGDGPKAGNSLQYWYLDPNRSLLRLVCRSWNQTILAMAREMNIKLSADESMKTLLDSVAANNKSASFVKDTTTQHRSASTAQSSSYQRSGAPESSGNSNSNNPTRRATAGGSSRTLRRSARLREASAANSLARSDAPSSSTPSSHSRSTVDWTFPYSATDSGSRLRLNFSRGLAASHGIQSDRHPRLFRHIIQEQRERRRIAKQNHIPIQGFYCAVPKQPISADGTGAGTSSQHAELKMNPWTCPPFISSLCVEGNMSRSMDPKEEVVISASYSGINPRPGGGAIDCLSSTPHYRMNEREHGSMLDHWLRAAVPQGLTSFSISRSADFGINGLLSLPKTLKTLKISRCPRVTGGTLMTGFWHLANLTSLTICSDIMFTDESFTIALSSLEHLRHVIYIYPCDPIQPAWRDLFRYCSSCELYHRRVTTKTYRRSLLMPELPSQIQDFTFEMDEPRFQHIRLDTFEPDHHGFGRTDNAKFSLSLWKAGAVSDTANIASCQMNDWCGFELSGSELRSWWPENLTRLDLSKSVVTDGRFDVPSRLEELIMSYPLEPNEIIVDESPVKFEEDKQWFPSSLTTLEVRGAPYHVSCEMQESPTEKVTMWMAYINKMLKKVPRQLEHLTISSFQIPDADAMTLMKDRVQKTLKTWKVRLLCPQRPKQGGFSTSQLYSPIIYVDESSDEEGRDFTAISSDDYDSDDSDDSEASFYVPEGPISRRIQRALYHQGVNSARAALRQFVDAATAEQYDVTPVMLREAIRGMSVLERLDVEVNYQHYRSCRAMWKGNLGLSESTSSAAKRGVRGKEAGISNDSVADIDNEDGIAKHEGYRSKRQRIGKMASSFTFSASTSMANNFRTADTEGCEEVARPEKKDRKGKGRKVECDDDRPRPITVSESKRPWEEDSEIEDSSSQQDFALNQLMGHGKMGRRPKTEIRYWNNSCCGKRCLGWIRMHDN